MAAPAGGEFVLTTNAGTGWLTSLRRAGDTNRVEFLRPGQALGAVTLRVRKSGLPWRDVRQSTNGVELTSRFRPQDDALRWEISVKNTGRETLEVGDLALPLPMNTDYVWDHEETFERRVFRHAFIAGHGSFLYWLPVKGSGSFLVMQPQDDTALEFFTATDMDYAHGWERFTVFVHSQATAEQEQRGTWRQARTSRVLRPGESCTNRFAFRWADSYDGVRELLFRSGGVDVQVAPGMVVPRDLTALLALRTSWKIEGIGPEFPADTKVEYLGERGTNTHLYRVRFSKLGENLVTVRGPGGWVMPLEFFVTEPLETLIKKRAAFIVKHQQHRDPTKWYDGLYSLWDRRLPAGKNLLGPDHLGGQHPYAVSGSDDPANSKCLLVAEKNAAFPDAGEIASLEYFIYDHPWPFASEMPIDSTAYESTDAAGKYALAHGLKPDTNLWHDRNLNQWFSHPVIDPKRHEVFLDRQHLANLACRGVLEANYWSLGSDFRGCGSASYTLSYMSQMGGWAVLDYALRFDPNPAANLRLGYASMLSTWALMNSGDAASNYGFWTPGSLHDGAMSWGFQPRQVGTEWNPATRDLPRGAWPVCGESDHGLVAGIEAASTVLCDDPIFGLIAFGGEVTRTNPAIAVIPRDGVRQRFHAVLGGQRLHLALDRDGFAAEQPIHVSRALNRLDFTLESRALASHEATLAIEGLPPGQYAVTVGTVVRPFHVEAKRMASIQLPVASNGVTPVRIATNASATLDTGSAEARLHADILPPGYVRGDVVSHSYVPIRAYPPKAGIGILPYLMEYYLMKWSGGQPLAAYHMENLRRIDLASQWSTAIMLYAREDAWRDELINLMIRAFHHRQLLVVRCYHNGEKSAGEPYLQFRHILEKLWEHRDRELVSPEGQRATGRQLINNLLACKLGDEGECGLGTAGLERVYGEYDRLIRLRTLDGEQPFRHIKGWYNMLGYAALNYNGCYAATQADVDRHGRVRLPPNTQAIGVDVYHYWFPQYSPFDPADLSIPREKIRAHADEWQRIRTQYYPGGVPVGVCTNSHDPRTWTPACWNDTHALMSAIALAGATNAEMWYIGVCGQLGPSKGDASTYTTPVETMQSYYDHLKAGPWVALAWWTFGSDRTCHGGLDLPDAPTLG